MSVHEPAPVLARRLLQTSRRLGRERVLPFWGDGGVGHGNVLQPGRHVLAAMPSAVVSATMAELQAMTLEGWLDRHLSLDGLQVIGLTYEAGYAGQTLRGGLTRPRKVAGMVATLATYPGWLERDGLEHPWVMRGDTSQLVEALASPPLEIGRPPAPELVDPHGFGPYRSAVDAIREGIAKGDYYQVNLARRLEAEFSEDDAPSLFMALRDAQPAAFAALWALPDGWLVSSSPECLLSYDRVNRRAHTFPIKGTIARSTDADMDQTLAARLMASEKDKAEHVMIVDLARNDLGRLAESVEVESLYATLPLTTLRHLVSDVAATIRPEVTLGELVGALFPGGSITGAPKIAAMNAIQQHEPFARGYYCGSLGVVTPETATFSILIRTAVVADGRLVYPVGGGLVWDSRPEDEWRETELKARSLTRALHGSGARTEP